MNYNSQMWAVTSYYNPMGYKRRLINYLEFKKNISIPMITVELAIGTDFVLKGENIIRVRSNSVLWHKERLLNIALDHIPQNVEDVCWLDCDVILEEGWVEKAEKSLKKNNLIQLFSRLFDQDIDNKSESTKPSGYSIAYLTEKDIYSPEDYRPNSTPSMRKASFGIAWAAKRDIMALSQFYDAMVVGSGDRALACAAYGRYDDAINTARMSPVRQDHYLNWAVAFNRMVNNKISFLDIDIYHLWHGDLKNRKYIERHIEFSKLDFNPYTDLKLNAHACWEWKEANTLKELFIKNYLTGRKEDGTTN